MLLSLCICKAHGRSTLSLRVKVGSLFKPGAPRRQWKAREVKCQDGNLAVIGLGTWTGANATASSDDLPHGYRLDPLASSASRRRRLDLNRVDQSAKADSGARSWPIQLLAVPGVAPSSDARQSVAMGRKCRGGGVCRKADTHGILRRTCLTLRKISAHRKFKSQIGWPLLHKFAFRLQSATSVHKLANRKLRAR